MRGSGTTGFSGVGGATAKRGTVRSTHRLRVIVAVLLAVLMVIGFAPLRAEAADSGYAPFASWKALVNRQYVDLTTKAPTASQSSSWVSQLSSQAKHKGNLVDSLRRGSENLANVDPVVRVYRAFLGRAPDAGGLQFWIKRKRNVAPAKKWTVTQIATEFTNSNEFKTKYGKLTNRQFVTQIYTDVLGRAADQAGVNYWTGKLDRKEKTKAQVVVGFSESNEYKNKQAQNTDVAVAYIYLMGRAPTSAEASNWVTRQKAGTAHATLARELLESPGYFNRIKPPTAPGAPIGVAAAAGSAQAQVSWSAPLSNGGSPITGYVVTPYTGSTAKTPVVFNTTATTQTITGLTNGTAYTFKVAARNAIGTGAQSSASSPVTPVAAAGLQATAIVSGYAHSCALISGGTVKCWGSNDGAQLGDGTTTNRPAPVTVTGLTGATSITAGYYHSCALISGGTVKCWGTNGSGQLGDGTTATRNSPVPVTGLTNVVSVRGGGYNTCAVISGGTAKCWGQNIEGQVGDGTAGGAKTAPATVSGLTGVTSLAVGGLHACAVVAAGAAKCWGKNDSGQLGNSGTTKSSVPVAVTGLTGATSVAAGSYHSCVLVAGGAAKCWGAGNYGQLGNGTKTGATAPVAVSSLTGATAISVGGYHTCAALPSGARCWGNGSSYKLGDGTSTDRPTPTPVATLSSATAVSTGNIHSCVLSGGRAKCWGWNNSGQLGDGTTTFRPTPVAVVG